MPTFGITPVTGFPPVTDDGFPRFIQFQEEGTEVGNRSVENLNFTNGAELSVSSDGSTVTVDLSSAGGNLSWRDVPGDTTLLAADAKNGLSLSGTSGTQTVTVPGGDVDLPVGTAILLFQYGAAPVQVVPVSGVALLFREELSATLAGQYATATLIKHAADEWLLCGDLAEA